MPPLRVCHVINNLHVGGAELTLFKILSRLDRGEWDPHVISLIDRGAMGERLEADGTPVEALGMRRGLPGPLAFARLRRAIQRCRPDVVQTWLYHAGLLGGLAAQGGPPVVWNIRHSGLDPAIDKRTTVWTVRLCAKLSRRLPARIVANSEQVLRVHADLGYALERMQVIPNGFDVGTFRPSESARRQIRGELGISHDVPVIGLVGRYHPQKDHATFVAAARQIIRHRPDVHFVLCGPDVVWENETLTGMIRAAGLRRRFRLLGLRDDMPALQASFDVAVSSSACGEGFPNVLGEAMACGVPCVATDVGGSPEVLGDAGRIVPPRQPQALADACVEILPESPSSRQRLSARARTRIVERFSLDEIAARYAVTWREVIGVAPETSSVREAA